MAQATASPPSSSSSSPFRRRTKRPLRRRRTRGKRGFFRRFWYVWVALLLTPVLVGGVGFLLLWRMYQGLDLPDIPPLPETSVLYAGRHELLTIHAAFDRTLVDLDQISESMQQAIVATEDKGYWTHDGISLSGMARAAWADIRDRELTQGGSTITQQYVKNVFTGDEHTITRKIQEAMLAMKLEKSLTDELGSDGAKRQILENYLNTIYFGHGAYGVEAAAQTYFSIPASQLNPVQSATLAGLVAAPSAYDPTQHKAEALARRNYALGRMAEDGYLTQEEAARMRSMPLKLNVSRTDYEDFTGDYFAWAARAALIDRYGEEAVTGGGLQVETTLDYSMQKIAEKSVAKILKDPKDPDAALVAIEPSTGKVLAMVGGKDFSQSQFNIATQAQRQAGSAFKPFTLLTAIQAGYSIDDYWYGPQTLTVSDERWCPDWTVSNAADGEAGGFTLKQATAYSVNTIFAPLVVAPGVGPERVAETAYKLGIRSQLDPVCSITLGTQGVTPMEMTSAYATLADGGVYHKPTLVQRVHGDDVSKNNWVDKEGKLAVKEPNDAYLTTEALEAVTTDGTGVGAVFDPAVPIAGKTGTTQDYRNAWFCGYTSKLATCVWMGYRKHERSMVSVEDVSPVFGGTLPATIWRTFMGEVYAKEGLGAESFPKADHAGYDRETPFNEPTTEPSPRPEKASPSPADTPTEEPSPTNDATGKHQPQSGTGAP